MLLMETGSESSVSVSCVLLFLAVAIDAVKHSPRDGICLVAMPSPDAGGRMELLQHQSVRMHGPQRGGVRQPLCGSHLLRSGQQIEQDAMATVACCIKLQLNPTTMPRGCCVTRTNGPISSTGRQNFRLGGLAKLGSEPELHC